MDVVCVTEVVFGAGERVVANLSAVESSLVRGASAVDSKKMLLAKFKRTLEDHFQSALVHTAVIAFEDGFTAKFKFLFHIEEN